MLGQKPPGGNNNSTRKRSLSHAEVVQCERATRPTCDCRCGGALHGANRAPAGDARPFFEGLPIDDPHHLQSEAEKRAGKSTRRQRRRQEQRERERESFFAEKGRRRAERVAAWEKEGVSVRV